MKLINRCKSKHSNCNQSICVPVSTVREHQCLYFPPPFNVLFFTFVYFDVFFFFFFLINLRHGISWILSTLPYVYLFPYFLASTFLQIYKSVTFNLFQYLTFSLFSSRSFIYVVFAFNFSFDSLQTHFSFIPSFHPSIPICFYFSNSPAFWHTSKK